MVANTPKGKLDARELNKKLLSNKTVNPLIPTIGREAVCPLQYFPQDVFKQRRCDNQHQPDLIGLAWFHVFGALIVPNADRDLHLQYEICTHEQRCFTNSCSFSLHCIIANHEELFKQRGRIIVKVRNNCYFAIMFVHTASRGFSLYLRAPHAPQDQNPAKAMTARQLKAYLNLKRKQYKVTLFPQTNDKPCSTTDITKASTGKDNITTDQMSPETTYNVDTDTVEPHNFRQPKSIRINECTQVYNVDSGMLEQK